MKAGKHFARAVRLTVAVLLLGALLYAVDWASLPRYVSALDARWAALAVAALGSHFLISPWKWRWALRIHGLQFRFAYLVRANGVGFFFNNFLPSAIGGDAYRIASTWPKEAHPSRAISAVVIERIVGMLALIAIGCVGALMLWDAARLARIFIGAGCVSAVALVVVFVFMNSGGLSWFSDRARTSRVFQALAHNGRLMLHAGRQWIPLAAISLLFQCVSLLYIYALFQALDAPLSLSVCALIAAVAGLATVLPISINGIGVVEGSFAGAAVALGGDYEVALIVAILIRLLVLPFSLIFGAVYAAGGQGMLQLADDAPRS